MTGISTKRESGAVSLFIVIFAMLIITVLTVSFLRIMLTDQQQASANDLSASALDSAQAGVEDAKRALLNYEKICNDTPGQCAAQRQALSTNVCNAAVELDGIVDPANVKPGTNGNPGEVLVQQSQTSNDSSLDQAYTCVKIQMASTAYEGQLKPQDSDLIPLVSDDDPATGKPLPFDTVTIRWFTKDDAVGSDASNLGIPQVAATDMKPLLPQANWKSSYPPIMRAQLLQFGDSFTLDSFDTISGTQSNANTVFLYPTSLAGTSQSESFSRDIRRTTSAGESPADQPGDVPLATYCTNDVASGNYACQMALRLPDPIAGGTRNAYLRLANLYNGTHFEVQLSLGGVVAANGSNIVKFRDVQPTIDSTGRANDLFRRVVTKVNLKDTLFPYPDATIDVTGNFCKDFSVTDTQYLSGSCTP
jgi:Tfp pilus assembly protein PilX